uniref:Mucin 13, cell surface associated n=1 Tax=Callithrix jacchus TaxID=9483 RepID=F7FAZ8_CALJA|nr:mucin-13 [Callithrix jacchus]XP_054102229.1 mucin-13 [Callithrix jacchus]
MKAVTHLTLLVLLFVNSATSQANLTAALSTTETATALPDVATADANETDFTEIVSTTTTPSSSTPLSSTSPIIDTNSSFTIPTPNATGNESTTDANLLSTPDIISSSPSDVFTAMVTSKTQSNNEVSPSTKDRQSSGPSTSTTSLRTSSVNTTGPSNPCQDDPCADNSLCVELHNTHFCLCLEGYYYNSSTCKKGKVFPGTILVKVSETFNSEEKNSVAYQDFYSEITSFFENVFGTSAYGQTVILAVSTPPSARSEMRAGDLVVNVTTVTILTEATNENEESVAKMIENAIRSNSGNIQKYNLIVRCDYYGCKKAADECINSLACECKSDLLRPNPQSPFCVASSLKCPDTCNAEHKQCLVKKTGADPECVCVPGYQADANGNCQKCAFGYSGLDCEDNFQLILTIVGTIAAIVILSMIIALIFTARSNNKKKDIEAENLIEEDFQNLRLQSTGFSNPGAEGSIFPKVRIAASKDSHVHNPYASHSVPRPDY